MTISLNFRSVEGRLSIPASKSFTQRVYAAALLHSGNTTVKNFGHSNDEIAALNIINSLGAKVQNEDDILRIQSTGIISAGGQVDCGESGLAARMFTPIAALAQFPVTITGSGSLLKRPMHFFEETLSSIGVTVNDFKGYLPFSVCGPLLPQDIEIDGSLGSQFVSGLLFAFSTAAKHKVTIKVTDAVSKPYLDLTLEVLNLFGKTIEQKAGSVFEIDPAKFEQKGLVEIAVESDWSSAAFWIAAAAIKGKIKLDGLNENSRQADRRMLEIVQQAGAQVFWEHGSLLVSSAELSSFECDLTDAPDLFPVLAVMAACCKGESSLKGLQRLANKESNREHSIAELLSLLAVSFRIESNTIFIKGKDQFSPINYDCPNDHRMAMAAALASMCCEGMIEIRNAACVDKSYPEFWKHISLLTK